MNKRRQAEGSMNEMFLQPWFSNNECAAAIRRVVPPTLFHKMRYYFEDWGCLICKSKERPHVSNGMCGQCAARIQKRLFWCLQRRGISSPERDTPDIPNGEDRVRSATTLLSDLARGEWTPKRMKLRRIKWSD
jgi:hypothetical protein